eukprot:CAMPEP_0181132974 /NCGR_PEP_ID=MMETSP1071-20121207/31284_1 /TAXON_ID=35127 /ORGANISM="Thalassiosira sp., Strain NH16" /LENGTH=1310 /DNA_ID=CAMNT_0023219349 /DNA_START=58 /DNA_END=3990 /DNA_ORIENTATION=+
MTRRPPHLIGTTTLAVALSGLATVSVQADGPPPRWHPRQRLNDDGQAEEYHRPAIVPVPSAVADLDEPRRGVRRLETRLRPQHRPHPSHLDGSIPVPSGGGGGGRQRRLWHSTTGTFRNLVLLLRFSDHATRPLPSRDDVSRLYNSEDSHDNEDDDDDVVPTGSVRQVYLANSHGTFTIDTTVADWITLVHPESYYADGNHGFTKFREAIIEGLDSLDDDDFDWTRYDVDENGALDGLGVLHSGYGAEFGGTDCSGAENESRIWSHKGGLDWKTDAEGEEDVVEVNRYYVSSALRNKCGSGIVRMGVICHELGHYLGLPDLYDPTFDGTGLGAYDFMSQSWGWDGSGMWPPNLSAWSRRMAGWATVESIDVDGTYSLEATALNDRVYEIARGYPTGEYLLIENRQPRGYDSIMEGEGGLAIYHVDENSRQRKHGYPGMDGWPANGEHYRVALLGADGRYDLERGTNQGDDGDLWHAGSAMAELSLGEEDDGGGGVYPNTDSYRDGILGTTGIRIYGFSRSGDVMTFSVEGLDAQQETQDSVVSLDAMTFASNAATPPPTPAPTPPPTRDPVTLAPTAPPPTSEPTSSPATPPPTPEPSTGAPSGRPSGSPATPSPTSHPTSQSPSSSGPSVYSGSPQARPALTVNQTAPLASQQQQPAAEPSCADLCLEPIPRVECPSQPGILHSLRDCADIGRGELCDGDGECGTDNFLNNCAAYDVYRRVDCGDDGGLGDGGANDAAAFAVSGAAAGGWNSLLQQQSSSSSLAPLTGGDPTSAPTGSPNETLTLPGIIAGSDDTNGDNNTGSNNNNSSGGYSDYYESQQGNDEDNGDDCPYYPGWNLGLKYCLKDCRQPPYMKANPSIFEFHSLEECCSLHYQGGASCRLETLLAMKKQLLQEGGLMANGLGGSIRGRGWRDVDGDGIQGPDERERMGGGVPDVPVDLYECGNTRRPIGVGTRTSTDGTYLIEDVPMPGSYIIRVKPPAGYHLSMGHVVGTDEEYDFDSDFDEETGLSECIEFTSEGGSAFTLNAGLIPDALLEEDETDGNNEIITETELVSMAVEGDVEELEEGEEYATSPRSAGIHVKTHTSDTSSRNDTSQEFSIGNAASSPSSPTSPPNSQAKSFLRGSSSSLSASITPSSTVMIDPTDDATIRSDTNINFVGGIGELRVGPQLSWHDEILLKFDLSPSALPEGRDYRAASHAILRLYSLTSSPSGGVVHLATSSDDDDIDEWTEEMVSWLSAPEVSDGHILAMIGPTRPNSWVEVDVTGMLLVETGVMTLRITSEGSNHSWAAKYSSKENGMGYPGPELQLYF